jgi:hypothetical protein
MAARAGTKVVVIRTGHTYLPWVTPDRYVTFDDNISSLIMHNVNKHLIAK